MTRTISITLPWPTRALSPNARRKWERIKAVTAARHDAYYLARAALKGHERPRLAEGERVNVRLICTPPDRRRRDEDNLLACCKAPLDGIAKALAVDDCRFHFLEQEWHAPEKPGRLVIEVSWRQG